MPSEQPKIDDGGPAFPQFTQNPWKEPFVTGGMSLLAYLASQESLSDICTEIWSMQHGYVEGVTGKPMPEDANSLEAAEYEALFFAKLRVMRAKALLRELQR